MGSGFAISLFCGEKKSGQATFLIVSADASATLKKEPIPICHQNAEASLRTGVRNHFPVLGRADFRR
jgi:hypothetical protein